MAGEARRFGDLGSKTRSHMAGGTVVGQDRVAFCQGSGIERALLSGESRPPEPRQAESGRRDGQQALPARNGIDPLEVMQIDALRELLGGSGAARHLKT